MLLEVLKRRSTSYTWVATTDWPSDTQFGGTPIGRGCKESLTQHPRHVQILKSDSLGLDAVVIPIHERISTTVMTSFLPHTLCPVFFPSKAPSRTIDNTTQRIQSHAKANQNRAICSLQQTRYHDNESQNNERYDG